MIEKAIEVKNLTVRDYDSVILKDITFSLEAGKLLMIIGPNGSGKTTLLKAILGLMKKEGEVYIFGEKISPSLFLKRKIAYVPQKFGFDRTIPLTALEFLELYSKDTTKIRELLKLGGILNLENKKIGNFSGGETQKLLIVSGLLKDPELFILDEPVAGIDLIGEKGFYDFIYAWKKEFNKTVVLVSHDVTVAPKMADRVLGLNKRMIFYGKSEEVLKEENFLKTYSEGFGVFKHTPCKEGEPCEFFKSGNNHS